MTDAFTAALDEVLHHEGGFANHPSDPGGVTMLGVTKRTWEGWTGKKASVAEMKALTKEKVAPVYRENYWNELNCDLLPPGIALCVFDFGVNAGPSRAARLLQGVVGTAVDGKIGPRTAAAAKAWETPAALVRAYQNGRRTYYKGLKNFRVFGKGWLRRVDSVETAALRLV